MGLHFLTTMTQLQEHYEHNRGDDFVTFVTFTSEYNAIPLGCEGNEVLDLSGFVRYGSAEPNKDYLLIGNMESRSVSIIPFTSTPSNAKLNEFVCLTNMEQFKCLFTE